MVILNELTQLSKMENSKVALRARQVRPKNVCVSVKDSAVCFECIAYAQYLAKRETFAISF